jgi:hypothetical protein
MHTTELRAVPAHGGGRRARPWALALLAAIAALAVAPSAASAWVYTDIDNFNLTETTRYIGPYTISSSGDGRAYYRWLDDPNHTTVISGNSCSDGAMFDKTTIAAHVTAYQRVFIGTPYLCFMLGARVAIGAGSMVNHDGRLQR